MRTQNCATDCVKKVKKQGFIHNQEKVLSTSYGVRMAFSKAGNVDSTYVECVFLTTKD